MPATGKQVNLYNGFVCPLHVYCTAEKADGKYQHAPSACDEEWQIHLGDQVNPQVITTGQGQTDNSSQQRPTTDVRKLCD